MATQIGTSTVNYALGIDSNQRNLCRTSDGYLISFAVLGTTSGTRLRYSISSDDGANWGTWTAIYTAANVRYVDAYITSGNDILLIYTAFSTTWQVYYVKLTYNDNGTWTLGTAYSILASVYGTGQQIDTASITQDSSGNTWVTFIKKAYSTTLYTYYNANEDGSGSWTAKNITASANVNGTSIIPVGNNIWCVYQTNAKLVYAAYAAGSWGAETDIAASGITNDFICIFKNTDSDIFAATRTTSGIKIYRYTSSWDSGSLVSNNASDASPTFAIIRESIWCLWNDYDGTNYDISYSIFNGSSWGTQVDITNDVAVDTYPSIAISDATTAWILYLTAGTDINFTSILSDEVLNFGETVTLTEKVEVTTYDEITDSPILSETISINDIPSIKDIVTLQHTSDGKVYIDYSAHNKFESSDTEITITLEYWNGATWNNCTTVVGDGLVTLVPDEWNTKQLIWDAKTDISGNYYAACKIRIKAEYVGFYAYWEGASFSLDTKNPIIVQLIYPTDVLTVNLIPFTFEINCTDNSEFATKFEISLLDGVSFSSIIESEWLANAKTWDYTDTNRPLMFGTWYWRATVKDIYQNQTVSSIYEFTVQDANTEIRIDSIVKETTGSGIVKILYSIKDTNNEKISVRFDYTENDGDTYHPCVITEVSSGTIEDDCFITDLVATPAYVQYWAKIQYSNDPEIQVVTDELKKKNLKISSKVYITRDGTDIDISNIVSSVDLSRSKQFGAAQLTTRCIDKDLSYNPNDITSTNNIVSSLYKPLIYIGNTIKFSFKFLTSSGIKTYNKFVGYINNVELSKNSVGKNNINITSQDYLQKLMNYMPENLEYKTTKIEVVNELLKTFDGITYYAEFGSWAEYPAPIVKVNNTILSYDKYIIDFVRGQVIYKGNTLSNLTIKTQECTNLLADRKTWELDMATDNSIKPIVYWTYQRYEEFACNDYTGTFSQWVDYMEQLHELDDYYIDYDEGIVYLYTALAANQTGTVIGNINNQKIVVTYKEATTVTVDYSYEQAGSNEVEDIIRDLATKAGIAIATMQDTITDEDLIVRNDNQLFTKFNNIDTLTLKRNGVSLVNVTDYELVKRDGTIELTDSDVNSKNKMIEDCDYLWDTATATESGETVLQEIDTVSKEEGIGSLKVTFPTNGGYVLRNLLNDLYNCSITTQKYIEFYIKTDKIGTIYLDISYNNINWETKTINATTTWTKIQWDISAIASAYKDIKYLKLRGTDIVVWIDNIYIKRNLYTATYTYYTLQATGITLSKVAMDYENTENTFSAMQDLLKNVAPNYLLYFDDNNKLVGYYSNQRLLRDCLNSWSNFNEGNRGYSRSYYGEHYRLNLPTNLVHNISDEDVYTGCIVIGKNTEPQNVALKGIITDDCSWVTGKGYALAITKTSRGQYTQSKAAIAGNDIIFQQLNAQNTTDLVEDAIDTLLDFDANTGYQWYAANNAPTPNILMCTLELETAILWDRIDILVGSYDGKVIKEMLYITVGDETGTAWWYTEKNKLKVEGGASGSWITFENNFNQNIKIKYVRVYMSEPWNWTTTTTTSGGKGGGGSSSASTDYFYAFSLGEIEVWEKATLIGKRTLDNVLLVGDGVTYEAQIPNTPYKTKDYLEYKWGWVEKFPETIELYSNSFSNKLIPDTDYVYDKTNGTVIFNNIPEIGDVISGTWTLDEKDPKTTTFYTSFTNIDLIRRIGLKYYKEVDEGLFNHEQTINRAGEILPELSRSVFPGNIDIVYRPDIKLGQSVLVVNEELSLNRIFYVDSINLGIEGFMPKCSLGITSYLELKDYEYQETVPTIYRDWKIHYPTYLPAFASYNTNIPLDSDVTLYTLRQHYTGGICVEALDDEGNVKLDYNEPCKLEIVSVEDSVTSALLENTIKAEMWEQGIAELNFYIQWNQDGLGSRAKTPTELIAEDKWYIDKDITFKLYEVNNPTKQKFFSTKIRLYLVGTLKPNYIEEASTLGSMICYDNYNIVTAGASTTKDGKQFATDNIDIHSILGADDPLFQSFIVNGQTIYRLMSTVIAKTYQIQYYDWVTETWINWGVTFILNAYSENGGAVLWGYFGGKLVIGATTSFEYGGNYYLFDGKVLSSSLSPYTNWVLYVFNNQLYLFRDGTTKVYNANGALSGTYSQSFARWNLSPVLFILKNELYLAIVYTSNVGSGIGLIEQYIYKWNAITHVWTKLYQYMEIGRAEPYIQAVYVYRNVAYLFYDTYIGGYWYAPFVGMFDTSDNQVYLKGYLTNKEWNILGTRAQGSSKGAQSSFVLIKGNVYGMSSSGVLKCMNPYFETSKKIEVFTNEM